MIELLILCGTAWLLLSLIFSPRRIPAPRVELIRIIHDSEERPAGRVGVSLAVFLVLVTLVAWSLGVL
ncbi:MAG: hypothetical protein HGA45_10700 [Chloroflexales bacterium]|nr:hypothetical protein [Chloroflexales bacterium]